MGKFKIKVNYSKGNSFHNEDTSDYIELSWDNLDIVKENLQYIKEHYEMYRKIEHSYHHYYENFKILEEYSKKDWFVGEKNKLYVDFSEDGKADKRDWSIVDNTPKTKKKVKPYPKEHRYDLDISQYCMKLKTDNGNFMQQRNFWCGYFEHLQSIEIVSNTEEFKIEF